MVLRTLISALLVTSTLFLGIHDGHAEGAAATQLVKPVEAICVIDGKEQVVTLAGDVTQQTACPQGAVAYYRMPDWLGRDLARSALTSPAPKPESGVAKGGSD